MLPIIGMPALNEQAARKIWERRDNACCQQRPSVVPFSGGGPMDPRTWLPALGLLLVLAGGACDDGADAPPLPLPAERQLRTLSGAERAQLCDWIAARFGGYGKTLKCADGSRSSRDSQAECVESLTGLDCEATVGDADTCIDLTLSCASFFVVLSNPACQRVAACAP
jgi:hypothetical protein